MGSVVLFVLSIVALSVSVYVASDRRTVADTPPSASDQEVWKMAIATAEMQDAMQDAIIDEVEKITGSRLPGGTNAVDAVASLGRVIESLAKANHEAVAAGAKLMARHLEAQTILGKATGKHATNAESAIIDAANDAVDKIAAMEEAMRLLEAQANRASRLDDENLRLRDTITNGQRELRERFGLDDHQETLLATIMRAEGCLAKLTEISERQRNRLAFAFASPSLSNEEREQLTLADTVSLAIDTTMRRRKDEESLIDRMAEGLERLSTLVRQAR